MKRRAYQITFVLSLLVAVATIALWVRSHFACDYLDYGTVVETSRSPSPGTYPNNHYSSWSLSIPRGKLMFFHGRQDGSIFVQGVSNGWSHDSALPVDYTGESATPRHVLREIRFAGFLAARRTSIPAPVDPRVKFPAQASEWYAAIPFWMLLIVAALVALVSWRTLRRLRIKPGCCRTCGYDLRASRERCPECGEASPSLA